MRRWTQVLIGAVIVLAIAGNGVANEISSHSNAGFLTRCKDLSVVVCHALDSESEIAGLRTVPAHLNASNRIQLDVDAGAARFTIPPRSGADSSGQLHIAFPQPLVSVYFSFDVRYSAELLRHRFKGDGGWKIFILGQGKEGCAPYEIVGHNQYYRRYPSFYYKCGEFRQVAVQNPLGNNTSQFDYQPGGDTACLRHPQSGTKPCAFFEPDVWVTYQVHIDALASFLEVWQTVRGKTLKIVDFQLTGFPLPPARYEWLKLTPYNTGKDPTEDHPAFSLWYRRVIVSSRKIPFPGAE